MAELRGCRSTEEIILRDPFDPTAPEVSADIPMIIGTALDDAGLRMTDWDLDEAGLKKWVADQQGIGAGTQTTCWRFIARRFRIPSRS